MLDRFAGLVLGLVAGVFLCWAIGAVLLYLPGETELRRSVQRSLILSEINDVVPPERLLEELERVDPIGVFLGPPAIVAPPDKGLAKDSDVVRASKASSASRDCMRARSRGIGVDRERGFVVTNAHVVAGIRNPRVDTAGGRAFISTVVAFDSTNDLAVLRVPGLGAPALVLAPPDRSTPVALVGYPQNGPLTRTPGGRWDRRGSQPGCVWQRAGDEADDNDPRVRSAGELRWPRCRRPGTRSHHGLRPQAP